MLISLINKIFVTVFPPKTLSNMFISHKGDYLSRVYGDGFYTGKWFPLGPSMHTLCKIAKFHFVATFFTSLVFHLTERAYSPSFVPAE